MAAQFGLAIIPPRPALVPLVFEGQTLDIMRSLTGVSVEVIAGCGKQAFREGMVFTHRGLSGPAILQISSYWREGESIAINFLPDINAESFLLECKQTLPQGTLKKVLGEVLPKRLAQSLAETYFPAAPIGEITNQKLRDVAHVLNSWEIFPSDSEGYAKAEVTQGGVSTHGLSSKTMEAKTVSGLYVIGEAVDVTGWLGGYNFQWAWSSGWAAGSAIG